MPAPDWLPPLIRIAAADGNWDTYLAMLYAKFRDDFLTSRPPWQCKRFALKRHPVIAEKEATFWHLISDGKREDDRLPDLERCARIAWPRAMIEAVGSDKVLVWRNMRGSNQRIVIALPDFSYVVILVEREEFVMVWTAYLVEQRHRQEKLRLEGEDSQKTKP
jgi:hypothetical protein